MDPASQPCGDCSPLPSVRSLRSAGSESTITKNRGIGSLDGLLATVSQMLRVYQTCAAILNYQYDNINIFFPK